MRIDRKRIISSNKNIIHLCRVVKKNIRNDLTNYKYADMLHHQRILKSLQESLKF